MTATNMCSNFGSKWSIKDRLDFFQRFCSFRKVVTLLPGQHGIDMLNSNRVISSFHVS